MGLRAGPKGDKMSNTIVGECNLHGNVVALCPFCQIEALQRTEQEVADLRRMRASDLQRIRELEQRLGHQ